MNFAFKKTTCRVLVVSLFALSLQTARAGLIGAEQVAPAPSPERAMLLSTLDRAEVAAQLQAAGVDPLAARERVQSMTNEEVLAMAHDIQAGPAGGMTGWGWAAIIVIAALIWYYAIRK
jgi:hypothetical protein